MANLVTLLFRCFTQLFTATAAKSHPLKKYRDQVVGHAGIKHLDKSLVPTKHNDRRLIVIGDVHGCLEELKHLLKKASFNKATDHIIFVGDLVAKGPFSLETLTYVDALGSSSSCVRGNHDDKLMQWNAYLASRSGANSDPLDAEHLPDGLSRRDEHRLLAKNLGTDQVNFLESLPYIIRVPMPHMEYLIVHAGLLPEVELHKQKAWDVTNMRNIKKKKALNDRESGKGWFEKWEQTQTKLPQGQRRMVLYGHDAGRDLNLRDYSKGLDSRCVRGGLLTAMVIDGRGDHYVDVQAKRRYD